MNKKLKDKMESTIWVAKSLYDRQRVSGSSANISFLDEHAIYISGSGTCFGKLTVDSFSKVEYDGTIIGVLPSKELPLHRILYQKNGRIGAVIHTHSFYSTLWSCIHHSDTVNIMPEYTPYLRMKLGSVGIIPYAKPGSKELFDIFTDKVDLSDGFLLANHGAIVGGEDIMSAFFNIEELEESARIAWTLRKEEVNLIPISTDSSPLYNQLVERDC